MLARCLLICFVLPICSSAFAQSLSEQDWPGWRGPTRDGHAPPSASPPLEFGVGQNVLWKSPVPGRGHSSPVVIGNQVFLATADEEKETQSVLCYDLLGGKQLWTRELSKGGFPKHNHPKNTEASTTIACNGESLFVTFFHHEKIRLSKLSLSGDTEWEIDAGPYNPRQFEYGYAASPLLFEELVIVVAEHDGESFIAAFEQATGSEVWRTPRVGTITFSSPVVATMDGRPQLLITGAATFNAYDPGNGKELWSVEATAQATCGTAVWSNDVAIASGGYPQQETVAVKADGSGTILWRNPQRCYEQSMIIVEGNVYSLTDRGILYCWRAEDGEELWKARLTAPISASPVYAGGHIYWSTEAGVHYVFKPNPQELELAATNKLGDEAFASPAVSGNRLLLRIAEREGQTRQEYLVCLGEKS